MGSFPPQECAADEQVPLRGCLAFTAFRGYPPGTYLVTTQRSGPSRAGMEHTLDGLPCGPLFRPSAWRAVDEARGEVDPEDAGWAPALVALA